MSKTIVALALAMGVAGCAGTKPVFPNLAGLSLHDERDRAWNLEGLDPDNHYVCELEQPTGTHIALQVCRTPRLNAERRQQAQDLVRRWQQQTIMQELQRTQVQQVQAARQFRPAPR